MVCSFCPFAQSYACYHALHKHLCHQVVLGALLHDVGHLVGERDGLEPMMTHGTKLGTPRHEVVGGLLGHVKRSLYVFI